MDTPRSLWTGAPHEGVWGGQYEPEHSRPPVPHASDDATVRKVLVYGPKGEPLVVQEPRSVGFRVPR